MTTPEPTSYKAHRRKIARLRTAHERATQKAEETRTALIDAVRDAGNDGMGPTELGRLSGWSKSYAIGIKAGTRGVPAETAAEATQ